MLRRSRGVTDFVYDAMKDVEELKTLQMFGSDSLGVNSYSRDFNTGVQLKDYKLTLTPSNTDLGVLPLSVDVERDGEDFGYNSTPVCRFDGIFEWDFHLGGYVTSEVVRVTIKWIGAGVVNITEV